MILPIRLAWRNVKRHGRRSLITAITIASGFAMVLFIVGIAEGSYRSIVDTAARTGAGHVVIQAKGHSELEPRPLVDPDGALEAAQSVPGARITQRVQASVLATSTAGGELALAIGVDPTEEQGVSILPESLIEGDWLVDEKRRVPKALVGQALAIRLELDLGDRLVLMVQGEEELEAQLFRVGGIFGTGSPDVDARLIITRSDDLRTLLGDPDAVHQIALLLDDPYSASAVASTLDGQLSHDDALTWGEALPELGDFVALDRVGQDAMFIVLFAIVGLAVLNAVLMSVLERLREFGVLLAIGTRPRMLFGIVVGEALILSLLSVAIGGVVGGALVMWLGSTGIDLTVFTGGEAIETAGYAIDGTIYPQLPLARTAQTMLLVVSLTVVGSLYPAWRAARIAPVEAIRHV